MVLWSFWAEISILVTSRLSFNRFSDVFLRSFGELVSCFSLEVNSSGASGEKRNPFSPSLIISSIPFRFTARAGLPQAISWARVSVMWKLSVS